MSFKNNTFKSDDGLSLYTAAWTPDTLANNAVVIAHGLAEHIHRYEHVAAFFVGRGYAVYGLDHRGHGKSEGLRTYFDSFDQPVEDLKRCVESIKPKHQKLFLYGHSMGSLISLLYVLKYPNDFAGLIVTGTPLNVDTTVPTPVIMLAKLLDNIIPKVNFLPLDSTTISQDAAVVAKYNNDPLVDRKPTRIHMGLGIMDGSIEVKRRMRDIKLPILILHGGADRLCPPSGSETLYAGVGSTDKAKHIYDGLYHEIHNEPQQGDVFKAMIEWMAGH
jgi:acylglycerol lipase